MKPIRWPAGALIVLLMISFSSVARAGETSHSNEETPAATRASGSPAIFVLFVGGIFHHRVEHYKMISEEMRAKYGDGIRTEIVFNGSSDQRKAWRLVRTTLDVNKDGKLSDAEKENARIILMGHSWGGPAVITFSKHLEREHIPVLLAIQIDSVVKPWETDLTVPSNVETMANFFQTRGFLHGPSKVKREDPASTHIMENREVPYDPAGTARCIDYSKFLRLIDRYHISIECNPHVWEDVTSLIDSTLKATNIQSAKKD